MHAQTPKVSGASRLAVLALALLLASCIFDKPKTVPISSYKIGGTVSGMAGTGLVLQDNGGDNLAITANGPFTFSSEVKKNASYNVTMLTQPSGQNCTVSNGAGTATANVANVAVACASTALPPGAPAVNLSFGVKELQFSWGAAASATFYRLLENPDGVSGYALVADNITATSYNFTIPVHKRMNASYIVEACNSGGCTGSQPQNVSSQLLTQAIGYVKASNTGAGDQFGMVVAVSGDGNTLAVGAPMEASAQPGVTPGAPNESATPNNAPSAGAVYVFARIAGVWTQQAYVKAPNPATFDLFGGALALSGDGNTLAVGARGQGDSSGAAYVFSRTAGTWVQQAFVTASNAEPADMFGISLALSGDGNTLAVGAFNEASEVAGVIPGAPIESATPNAVSGGNGAGAVYVYTRSGAAWSQQAYVKASNPEASDPNLGTSGDLFGSAIALNGNGNTLAVGASFESSSLTGVRSGPVSETTAGNGSSMSGAAYVFLRSGTTWAQQAYVKASNTGDFDTFGSAVALSSDGNTLAVGAYNEGSDLIGVTPGTPNESATLNNAPGAGAVYVYTRNAGAWTQQAYVKASNADAGDNFGSAVALNGDGSTLAVGAPLEASALTGVTAGAVNEATSGNASFNAGVVYVYARNAGAWSQQAYVKASNTGDGDQFGFSVALSGDGNTLAVGAPFEDGSGVGVSGMAGVVYDDVALNAGAVYVYSRSGTNWAPQTFVKASNTTTGDKDAFGSSVALSNDGNTLAIGAPDEDGSGTGIDNPAFDNAVSAGAVYLY